MVTRASFGIATRQLDWTLSTTQVFSHFAELPWAILLDSADAPHRDAKFDIICAFPIATLVTNGDQTDYTSLLNFEESETSSACPFSLLNGKLNQLFPQQFTSHLPFSGGAMGCFSYDLGRRIETLPVSAEHDITLPELNIGFYDWALIFDYQTQGWSLVHYLGEAQLDITLQRIEQLLQGTVSDEVFTLTSPWLPQLSAAQYQERFARVQDYLHSGDCYQINLTQRFSTTYQGNEWSAYLKLRQANRAPFSAFIRLEGHAILSISPERFIKLEHDVIQTKPIKGTLARHQDPELDRAAAARLQASTKDRAENVMIVDLLRNDIGKVAQAGSVTVPHLFEVESFPAVHHLVSTISAKLAPSYCAADLLKAAFPGGSITGAPKIRAMEIIEELEPCRRSIYCGSIGYISQDRKMDTSITIRTIVTQGSELFCWAGGGIVADSNVAAEYQESFDKLSKILPVLESA